MLQTIFGMMFVRLVLRLIDGLVEWTVVLLWLAVAALLMVLRVVGRWIARCLRLGSPLRPNARPGARCIAN